ncbi:MAG TPA: hypothetical protein VGZ47_17200 [Gemmataceae bacterium]|jgi:hypothetical protein|nr:hypothetical protein [Gemmataceae bacterium]
MHKQPEFLIGMVMGALVAGFICGLMPLGIALSRKRVDLAIGSMIVCIFFGFLGGVMFAFPAALVAATAIFAFTGRARERDLEEGFSFAALDREVPVPMDAHTDKTLGEPSNARTQVKKISGQAVRCSACGFEFWPGLGPTPPWCKMCGADLRAPEIKPKLEPQATATATAESLTAKPPS